MVFFRDIGVGRHDLNPQNSPLFLRFKSDARLAEHNAFIKRREIPLLFSGALTKKSLFLDGH